MVAARIVTYQRDQIAFEAGQVTWVQGALIARSTIDPQAGRLSTSNADEILGAQFGALPANADSFSATDQLPQIAFSGTGIPILVEASATIAAFDHLTPSSVTPGTVRTATAGEKRIGRAITTITSGGATNLVMTELFPLAQHTGAGAFGTASTGVTVSEEVSGSFHKTTLTVSSTLPAIAGGADLAVGKALYTFPTGVIQATGTYMSMALTAIDGNIGADTPDGGLGMTIASGAVAVLGGTPGFEDILTGQTFDDAAGTAEVINVTTNLAIQAADSHTLWFNVADGWAAGGEAACPIAGTVTVLWVQLV